MRNTDDRRATYYQSRQKALAQAETRLAIEAVLLQAEAIAAVTDWPEYRELADQAKRKESTLAPDGAHDHESRIPPADTSDVNHE